MLFTRPLSFILLLAAFPAASQAAVIWYSDFSSYDTTSGPVSVTVDSTGNNNTLSGTAYTTGTGLSFDAQVMSSSSLTNPLSGNALRLTFTNSSGSSETATGMTVFQGALPSLGGNGIYVLSTDVVRSSSNSPSGERSWAAAGDATLAGSNNTTTSFVGTTPLRFTQVINQTGSAIALPGSLGSLNNNSMATYFFDGVSTYSGLTITSASSANITGFATGPYRSNSLNSGLSVVVWYDNMAVWNSLDSVNGVSILSLAPGTLVPEPSTAGFIPDFDIAVGCKTRPTRAGCSLRKRHWAKV